MENLPNGISAIYVLTLNMYIESEVHMKSCYECKHCSPIGRFYGDGDYKDILCNLDNTITSVDKAATCEGFKGC